MNPWWALAGLALIALAVVVGVRALVRWRDGLTERGRNDDE